MKKILKSQEGFTLIIVALGLALISILGFTIVSVSMSNFKMTSVDSKSQSAYYIAEAGINYMLDGIHTEIEEYNKDVENGIIRSSEEFFRKIEDQFCKELTLDDFKDYKDNKEMKPKALVKLISIDKGEDTGNTRDYKIESIGQIGNSKRQASAEVSISWDGIGDGYLNDLIMITEEFRFNGLEFNAPGKTIVIAGQDRSSINGGGKINVKNIYLKGLDDNVISGQSYGDKTDPGDIYLDGGANILDSGRIMYGNVHTNGDFIVTGGVTITGNLYVGGKFKVAGGSHIHGNVYVKDRFQIEGGAKIDGNVYAFNGIEANGGGEVKGDLNVEGKARLANITIFGFVNINGDLEIDWEPIFYQDVNYTGRLIKPREYKPDKCKPIEYIHPLVPHDYSFAIPNCAVSLKSDNWYIGQGYEVKKGQISDKIPGNAKWLVDNYENTTYQKIAGKVTIISKGDIILRGGDSFEGALIAPNGIVKYTGGNFEGIIISNNGIYLSGWGYANVQSKEEYFGKTNIPIDFDCVSSENGNNNNQGIVTMAIKNKIKEE